jgi:hypothetical protein
MALISPIIEEYRKCHRLKQVGSYDGNKSKVVSLPFNNFTPIDGFNFYFPADPMLDGENVVITEISVVSSTAQSQVFSRNGTVVDNYPASQLNQAILVMVDKDQTVLATLPLYTLCQEVNGGKPSFVWFDSHVWQNCYILFDAQLTPATSYGLNIRVTYLDKYINA